LERLQIILDKLDAWYAQPRSTYDMIHSSFLFHGFVLWWSVFFIAALTYTVLPISRTYRACLSLSQRAEWISRVVSNLNAMLMVSASSILLWQVWSAEPQGAVSGPVLPNASAFYVSQALLLAYFCYDASLILLFLRTISSPWSSLAHHLFSAMSIVFCFFIGERQPLALIWATGISLTEISTPLVNARWFLSFRYRERWQYKAVGIGMLLAFLIGRDLYIPLLVFGIIQTASKYVNPKHVLSAFWLGLVGGSSSLAIWLLNMYWTMLMLRGARKLFRQPQIDSSRDGLPLHPALVGPPATAAEPSVSHLKSL
jgi:hypothetical protein